MARKGSGFRSMWWPFRRRPAKAHAARIAAFRHFEAIGQPTANDAEVLLRVWEFDIGEKVTVFLVRPANMWRHKLLPEPQWALLLEEGAVLHAETVERICDTVTKLAERLGVRL